jgi:RNA polymerase sigma-70 factor (ECF subfamily)
MNAPAPARDITPDPAARSAQRTGSKELLDIFMARRPRLVQMATRIIGCQCLAEDVVQETMLKICEGGLDAEVKSPAAYLFRMVRNLAIDCGRRRAREQRLDNPDLHGDGLAMSCPCPETIMVRCQALRIVMAALQELPERTRHAFELHRLEGVSQRDIAERIKVSPTLVNFMVRDAHNHCRLKLLDHAIESDIVPPPAGRAAQQAGKSASGDAASAKPGRHRQTA